MSDRPDQVVTLPRPMGAISDERVKLIQMLDAIEASVDPVERADLAMAVAQLAARYQNVEEEALHPTLAEVDAYLTLERAREDQRVVREALKDMHRRSRHVKPINAHADDPDGFEQSLETMVAVVRAHLDHEVDEVVPLVEHLEPTDAHRLSDRIEAAAAHASSLPDPPSNPLWRKVAEFEDAIERAVHDESTPWHPGIDQVDEVAPETRPEG